MSDGTQQVVVVTGASGGIGRAVARAYGQRGARVALLARGTKGLDGAATDVRQGGGEPLPIELDVSDSDKVIDAADRVENALGPIDVWVNAAFSAVFAPVTEIEPREFRRVTEVDYLGFVHGTLAALRHMRPRDRGAIVQVGSALAYRGVPLQAPYCASKHAIQGFHESLRCELLHERSGVSTTMVQLPAVNTPQFSWVLSRLPRHPQPLPPIYQPEVAARAVLHAGDHPKRREYWIGGSTVGTLLANALAPGLLDRYLARNGYSAQQSDQDDPALATNLWEPADGPDGRDYGAHGVFDRSSHRHSRQLWASHNHSALAAAGAAVTAVGLALLRRRR
ncbi:NAD(P)-dependent dehydrogenase (short-subunit alcohol dehydrogenase family) [Saccharopolyspora lacisalsi]|uniref:NAD(P)-dependent dehydrogenase (Short-subunit alcohol dehydrogenase family) n=1 Tax=Halosaccharopolyspora lacisalsi TaxID=1000566 RepID=A0A839DUP3_9PSEU|nr:SDR family oxidoreductase [Halosaccharopolyspora lacisalsi]MBA8823117.1 NAD(P)-dependent dehydrogenase (short-subunit alcohol dehydrogenase family) [Halosaccharopolyspora lacisalsi]